MCGGTREACGAFSWVDSPAAFPASSAAFFSASICSWLLSCSWSGETVMPFGSVMRMFKMRSAVSVAIFSRQPSNIL